MTDPVDRRSSASPWIGAEVVLSVVGVCLVFAFPAHLWVAYFCLGDCQGPDAEAVRSYRVLVGVLAAVVVATLAVAWRRGARLGFAWHAFVALLGATSAIVFQVPVVDWTDHLREQSPAPSAPAYPCRSGSGDCRGG